MADLFDTLPEATPSDGRRPLADRLRPRALSEVIGQGKILSPYGPLGAMLAADGSTATPSSPTIARTDARMRA